MIVGLFTEMLAPGGIQRISQHIGSVLSSFAKDSELPYCFLSLKDPEGFHEIKVNGHAFSVQGFGFQKHKFVLAVLKQFPKLKIAFLGHPNLAVLGLAMKICNPRMKYFVETYGIDVWGPKHFSLKLGLKYAEKIIALSSYTASELINSQKINSSSIEIIPPALDPVFLNKDKNKLYKRVVPAGKILLTVSRLAASERYKGVETVIQSLPKLLTDFPDLLYVIVGDGDDRLRLENFAKDLGLEEKVLFVGNKSGEELLNYYNSCDIFVMPSLKEGFGVVFLEAMAFGKPVIGGKHGGTLDLIDDGVNGFLVEHGDVNALVDRVKKLLYDNNLLHSMGEAGKKIIKDKYSLDCFYNNMYKLLKEGD